MIPLIDLNAQYLSIKDEIEKEVLDVLGSSQYIMGPKVKEFEKSFSEYVGTKYAISCANGTDALVLSLQACGIEKGDEVITTPFTFFATAEAISRVGATPVFVDVYKETFNINVDLIEEKVSEKTKAILPVHIFGQPVNMDKVREIAEKYNIYIIEDACQAIGATYNNRKAGSLGTAACFSFFPTKNLGAYGDGGMITTDDERLSTIIKALRVHGSGNNGLQAYNILYGETDSNPPDTSTDNPVYDKSKYYNYLIAYNSRLDEIQAAILLVKLKHIDEWNMKRRETANYLKNRLQNSKLVLPEVNDGMESAFHMYVLQSENRNYFVDYLKKKGISTGIYYPVPLHMQKAYKDLGYRRGDLPVSEYLSERTFAIPIYPELTEEQKEYIADSLLECQEALNE